MASTEKHAAPTHIPAIAPAESPPPQRVNKVLTESVLPIVTTEGGPNMGEHAEGKDAVTGRRTNTP